MFGYPEMFHAAIRTYRFSPNRSKFLVELRLHSSETPPPPPLLKGGGVNFDYLPPGGGESEKF